MVRWPGNTKAGFLEEESGPQQTGKQYREGDGVSGRGFIGTMIKSKRKLLV